MNLFNKLKKKHITFAILKQFFTFQTLHSNLNSMLFYLICIFFINLLCSPFYFLLLYILTTYDDVVSKKCGDFPRGGGLSRRRQKDSILVTITVFLTYSASGEAIWALRAHIIIRSLLQLYLY